MVPKHQCYAFMYILSKLVVNIVLIYYISVLCMTFLYNFQKYRMFLKHLFAVNSIKMKNGILLLIFLLITTTGISQEKLWKVDIFSFFDNTEFRHSAVQIPQTMSGIRFAPELGLSWDSVHNVDIGINVLHEFGSKKAIDNFSPVIYYTFDKAPFRFYMGAFPRKNAVEEYPRIFFQDSISYYRPDINGLFWEFYRNNNYINVWLDWTSRQSQTIRETFFMGFAGRYNLGFLYLQHFGYMFHFAGKKNPIADEPLHDNGLFLTSLGLDFAKATNFEKLEANAGWVVGLERSRGDQTGWFFEPGILLEAKIEYKGIGIFNSFYKGHSQMKYYNIHTNELYWGDPVYRAKTYNRSDMYINFLNNNTVNIKFIYSLHFVENKVYSEQLLKVIFDLNNFEIKQRKQTKNFWNGWFN
jgi:hypothetical protein